MPVAIINLSAESLYINSWGGSMPTDYSELPYFDLKSACVKKGLSGKGKKHELIARLSGLDDDAAAPTTKPDKPTAKSQESKPETTAPEVKVLDESGLFNGVGTRDQRLEMISPSSVMVAPIDTSKYEPYLLPDRLQRLQNALDEIAAQKGRCKFELSHATAVFCVHFEGGSYGNGCMTLIAPDAAILYQANKHFNSRTYNGVNNATSMM